MTTPYYSDDYVTLYHGDCREIDAWLSADVLVTDPPYGVKWEAKHGDNRGPARNRSRTPGIVVDDDNTDARDDVLVMWGSRPAMVFGSWRMPRPSGVKSLLVWNKDGAYSARCRAPFFTVHEEVYVLGAWPMPVKPMRSVITTREHRSQHTAAVGHPTPKPADLMERLVGAAPESCTIADPFAGSGSTLVAAKRLGRKAIGIEIDERYCEIAAKRLAQGVLDFGTAS